MTSKTVGEKKTIAEAYRSYRVRWLVLGLFVLATAGSTMQWIQYTIVADVMVDYYKTSYAVVNWSAMTYLLMYTLFILPGCFVTDKVGLRKAILLGTALTCLGSWLKVASVSPDRFWMVLVGQSIVAASEVFMMAVPPRLAAVWFEAKEVSTACSVGVFGTQFGIAVGFLIPPFLVQNNGRAAIETGLYKMLISVAIVNTLLFVALYTFFEDKPKTPPSPARSLVEKADRQTFFASLRILFCDLSYLFLTLAYGIIIGVFYTISTLLNTIILNHYPNAAKDAGTIGLLMVLAGMGGSIMCGIILDKFHRFRLTIVSVYLLCFLAMVVFTFTLNQGILPVYVVSVLLGFFMTGLLPIGYEVAAEITYPVPEDVSSGIMTAAAQSFGIGFTYLYAYLLAAVGNVYTNLSMCALLVVGLVLVACVRYDLKRQKIQS